MNHMTTCLIFRFSAFENSDENVSIEVTPFNDLIRKTRELIISLFDFLHNEKVVQGGGLRFSSRLHLGEVFVGVGFGREDGTFVWEDFFADTEL